MLLILRSGNSVKISAQSWPSSFNVCNLESSAAVHGRGFGCPFGNLRTSDNFAERARGLRVGNIFLISSKGSPDSWRDRSFKISSNVHLVPDESHGFCVGCKESTLLVAGRDCSEGEVAGSHVFSRHLVIDCFLKAVLKRSASAPFITPRLLGDGLCRPRALASSHKYCCPLSLSGARVRGAQTVFQAFVRRTDLETRVVDRGLCDPILRGMSE